MKSKIIFFCLLILLSIQISPSKAGLSDEINEIISRSSQKNVNYSISVADADTGKFIYKHDHKEALIPASNMKLIVTAVAIEKLGTDFEYVTSVGLSGNDLMIKGSGDPLLGDHKINQKYERADNWLFDDIVKKVRKENIESIDNIILDTSIFDNNRVHPSWPRDQLNRWYAAEVSGLNYNNNIIEMTTRRKGNDVKVLIEPETDFIKIDNQIKPIYSGSGAVGAYRTSTPNVLEVKGRCRNKQGPFEVAIEHPAAFLGYLIAERLAASGIELNGKLIERRIENTNEVKVIATYRTSIKDCLERSNKDSLQLAAECLFKTLAAYSRPSNTTGSWKVGRQVISDQLKNLNINSAEFYIDDGSGLSRKNRLSSNAITRLLIHLYNTDYWTAYEDSLAIGGIDGTIDRYFRQQPYKNNIKGKTGYIRGVKSFSGICKTDKGDYIFSIIANQIHSSRKPLNDIAKAIIDEFSFSP